MKNMAGGIFEKAKFRIAGDRGLLVEYGETIDPGVNQKVRSMTMVVEKNMPDGIKEVIPTYRSILVLYDPAVTTPTVLQEKLTAMEERLSGIDIPPPKVVDIPVCYGGEFGPDIDYVAESHGLSAKEVVRIHSEPEYLIYMVGFTPGFPFLGGLSEKLHTPRLETPRTSVPAGSVGIANNQTGIYPITSPGGWQLIGRTPLRLFSPERVNPFLYQAGDRIRFKPISSEEYDRLAKEGGE
ncbi:MAG: 5-oxoprolinase subunit PxpB [Desulfobacterales bacterium]|nr:MAG: 5-oxoprolinase subunit PxpB [Desulfobacterales bacterium]